MPAMVTTLIILGLIAVLAVYVWSSYHSLRAQRVRVDEAWNATTVQLKRRAELVPQLLDAVKAYAGHEQGAFDAVTQARAETISARLPAEATLAEAHMQQAMKRIFAVAEAYPQLQASQSFLGLQSEFADGENKIQAARRLYNGGVRECNTKLQLFPNNLIAKASGFARYDFFEVDEVAQISEPPRIQF